MPRNLLVFIASLMASVLAFATAASAADYMVEQEMGYAVGVEEHVVAVEEDDRLVDIDIDLGLFDDDEDEMTRVYEVEPGAPYYPE